MEQQTFITDKNNLTAVEWLCNELHKYINGDSNLTGIEIKEQAKQMEKEQIIDAWKMGRYDSDKIVMTERFYAEQYFAETYGSKGSDETKNDNI